ncbi:hypothetical protein L6654_39530 [Bradyrhizobium sp. WYCCWR 13023]|uniref:PEP-CTERM protein-sorting domain-containing protein n=1 Tax=Bradyrhizobium zhengyangense TaxID=2911009 RepID=A0A9X1RM13_9BRAD|nr:hypothetical protein [Bradyrhizobium zhengyangense]MCG2632695.1 hypothetical protein [Bradyrhizobium zhengyangense]
MASRWALIAVVSCLIIEARPASAEIDISISSTAIPVGGTVELQVTNAFAPLPLSGMSWLESIYPAGSQISVSADDFAANGSISYNAPGSEELTGSDIFSFASGIGFSLPLLFTYNHAGLYKIDYDYSFTEMENLIGAVFDGSGNLIAGPDLENPPPVLETGSGSLLIRVGSVPETSTWTMIMLGFVGLGLFRRRQGCQAIFAS